MKEEIIVHLSKELKDEIVVVAFCCCANSNKKTANPRNAC